MKEKVRIDIISIEKIFLEFCIDLISSKMESLKYLNLNFKPYLPVCDCSRYTPDNYVELYFDDLIQISHLETIIIGRKFTHLFDFLY
jgi:hypothetical protein